MNSTADPAGPLIAATAAHCLGACPGARSRWRTGLSAQGSGRACRSPNLRDRPAVAAAVGRRGGSLCDDLQRPAHAAPANAFPHDASVTAPLPLEVVLARARALHDAAASALAQRPESPADIKARTWVVKRLTAEAVRIERAAAHRKASHEADPAAPRFRMSDWRLIARDMWDHATLGTLVRTDSDRLWRGYPAHRRPGKCLGPYPSMRAAVRAMREAIS
jgi:hypothetical protein